MVCNGLSADNIIASALITFLIKLQHSPCPTTIFNRCTANNHLRPNITAQPLMKSAVIRFNENSHLLKWTSETVSHLAWPQMNHATHELTGFSLEESQLKVCMAGLLVLRPVSYIWLHGRRGIHVTHFVYCCSFIVVLVPFKICTGSYRVCWVCGRVSEIMALLWWSERIMAEWRSDQVCTVVSD